MNNSVLSSVPLSEIADFTNGYGFGPADWGNSGLPIIRIQQLLNTDAVADAFAGSLDAKYRIDTGDLIMAWSGTLAVVRWDRGPAWLNQHLFRVDPKAGVDGAFLRHLLISRLGYLEAESHGTTMRHIKRGDLLKHAVPLPPLEEQRRIAEMLDTIDETIQATERVIAKRRALRAGLAADLLKPPSVVASSEKSNGTMRSPASTSTSKNWDMAEDGRQLSDYADLNPENLGSGTPGGLRFEYLDLSSVTNGSVIESHVETVTFGTAPSRARRIARKDDFLFGTVRPLQKSHAWAPRACIASTGIRRSSGQTRVC